MLLTPPAVIGQVFAEIIASWRNALSTAPPEIRLVVFQSTVNDVGKLIARGLDKPTAADQLRDIAITFGLLEQAGEDEIQRIVADAFANAASITTNGATKPNVAPPSISASPFIWRDPANIPPRHWLYARHYVRRYLTCTIAPGGVGKTSLAIGEALAMASGRPLLGIAPAERARVWIWNGEDPRDELDRRIVATMLQHKLMPEDIAGNLFVNVGRETPIILATQTREGTMIAQPSSRR